MKIQNFLDKVKIPKGQLYYQFQLTASTTIDDPVVCLLTYQKVQVHDLFYILCAYKMA